MVSTSYLVPLYKTGGARLYKINPNQYLMGIIVTIVKIFNGYKLLNEQKTHCIMTNIYMPSHTYNCNFFAVI